MPRWVVLPTLLALGPSALAQTGPACDRKRISLPGTVDHVDVDPSHHVVVVSHFRTPAQFGGRTYTPTGRASDPLLTRHDPKGDLVWARHIATQGYTWVGELVVDDAANVTLGIQFTRSFRLDGKQFAAGEWDPEMPSGKAPRHGLVVRLNVDGTVLWTQQFPGRVSDVDVGSDGGVVAVGALSEPHDFGGGTRTPTGAYSGLVLALGPDGAYRWDRLVSGSGDSHGAAVAVHRDRVVAYFDTGGAADFGMGLRTGAGAVVSYSPDGTPVWDRAFEADYFSGERLAVDAVGRVFWGGQINGRGDLGLGPTDDFKGDAFVLAFAPTGETLWHKSWREPGPDHVTGLGFDGNLWLVGLIYDDNDPDLFAFARVYDPGTGEVLHRHDFPEDQWATDVAPISGGAWIGWSDREDDNAVVQVCRDP